MLSREAGERQKRLDLRDEAGQPVSVVPSGPPGRQGEQTVRRVHPCRVTDQCASGESTRCSESGWQRRCGSPGTRHDPGTRAGAVTSRMNRAVDLDETLQLRLNVLDTIRIPGRSCWSPLPGGVMKERRLKLSVGTPAGLPETGSYLPRRPAKHLPQHELLLSDSRLCLLRAHDDPAGPGQSHTTHGAHERQRNRDWAHRWTCRHGPSGPGGRQDSRDPRETRRDVRPGQ